MYIYKITNRINNKIYIGQTIHSIESRFAEHCRRHNTAIDKAIQKYGKENFTVELICKAQTLDELNKLEQYYIKQYNSTDTSIGYNMCDGGANTSGYHHRPDSKAKMSKSRMGIFAKEKNPFYGKHHSDESKRKMHDAKVGMKLTDEWKQHISDTSPRKHPVYCVTTDEHFSSINEAAMKYNIKSTHISRVCRGVRKSCKGFKFIYDNTVPSSDNISEKV